MSDSVGVGFGKRRLINKIIETSWGVPFNKKNFNYN